MRQQIGNCMVCCTEYQTMEHAAMSSKLYGMQQQIANYIACGSKNKFYGMWQQKKTVRHVEANANFTACGNKRKLYGMW